MVLKHEHSGINLCVLLLSIAIIVLGYQIYLLKNPIQIHSILDGYTEECIENETRTYATFTQNVDCNAIVGDVDIETTCIKLDGIVSVVNKTICKKYILTKVVN